MGIRKYKPTTPGRRGASVSDFSEITRSTPEKSLVRPLHGKGGRNVHGRVTTRHQGGGHKRAYRLIDFRRNDKDGIPAKIARSAGAGVQLVAKDGPYAQLRMPSGEIRNVDVRCRATIGEVGNAEHSNINWGKAGRMRWKGKRPTVRGVAMNPVDHPHGGGEGKTSGGRHPVNPKGKPEGRTRKRKASDALIVRRRRTNKKR